MSLKETFERDGYALIKGVFSREEAEQLREAALKLKETEPAENKVYDPQVPKLTWFHGDILSKPGIDHLVFDDRMLRIVREVLGDEIVYFGDSNFQIGQGCRGLHKDCVDREDPEGPDWKSPYTIVRMGLYLEDHARHSGGVKIRKGSHLYPDTQRGRLVDIPSEIGDVAIWKLTTTHSGNVVRMRFLPGVSLHTRFENRLPDFLKLPEERERVGLFFTYGLASNHLDRYIANYIRRADYFEHWRRSRGDEKAMRAAREKGVLLLKPTPDYGSLFREYHHGVGANPGSQSGSARLESENRL
jgi:hypothetical protein